MARWAIGDIHGCYDTLRALIERAGIDPKRDEIWLVGDIINRGPRSLDVLRWAMSLPHLQMVLGNHEIHFLAVAAGVRKQKNLDSLNELLNADELDEFVDWIRTRPLMVSRPGWIMVHAALMARWKHQGALRECERAEALLCGPNWPAFIAAARDAVDPVWTPELRGTERSIATLSMVTRGRACTADGSPDYRYKMGTRRMPKWLLPWYEVDGLPLKKSRILFGHWAAHGARRVDGAVCLDGGCVWGRDLVAYNLDSDSFVRQPAVERW